MNDVKFVFLSELKCSRENDCHKATLERIDSRCSIHGREFIQSRVSILGIVGDRVVATARCSRLLNLLGLRNNSEWKMTTRLSRENSRKKVIEHFKKLGCTRVIVDYMENDILASLGFLNFALDI